MAGASSKTNAPRARKRVEAETGSLKRAKDGSAFTRCEECKKDVPVVLIDMHNCSLDSKIRMNLESTVAEKAPEPKKPAEKSRATKTASKPKKSKKSKDPNMPKRPQTAFFLFMDDFRKLYKEENPESKGVALVAKEGGEKWKAMTEEKKKPYLDKHAELKVEYEKAMEKFNSDGKDVIEVVDQEQEGSEKEEE